MQKIKKLNLLEVIGVSYVNLLQVPTHDPKTLREQRFYSESTRKATSDTMPAQRLLIRLFVSF